MRCVVSTCQHDSNSTSFLGYTYHKFPVEPSLRVKWVNAINKEYWNPTEDSLVCSNHFFMNDLYLTDDGVCKLREDAVPITQKEDKDKNDKIVSCDLEVCRICFAKDCNLYSMKLFKNLKQAFGTLTGIWIQNKDDMPPYLCSECSHQLMNYSKFRTKILQAHSSLEDILRKHDSITLESIKCVEGNQSSVESNISTKNNEIYHCNVEIELVKNEKIDTDEEPTGAEETTDLHRAHEHFIAEPVKKEKDDMSNPNSRKHQDVITNNIVYSPTFQKYIVPKSIREDIGDASNVYNYHETTDYDMTHSNVFVAENHSSDVVRTIQEAEEMAMRIADNVENITRMTTHLNQQKNNLKPAPEPDGRHTDKVPDICTEEAREKSFTCSICKKSFSQKSWLMNHLRIHSGERPYTCEVCKKTFNDKSNYRKHLRIHSGEKPYPCKFCDKTFNRKNYLENHLRTHSGEKPYACVICNKVFSHKHHLKSHLRIHSGEKPFSCHICNKDFSEKSNLHMHLKVHSGDRLYSCIECNIAFSTKYLLKCHSRVHAEKSEKLLYSNSWNVPM